MDKKKGFLWEIKIYDKDFNIIDKRTKINFNEVKLMFKKYEGENKNDR